MHGHDHGQGGCPGARMMNFDAGEKKSGGDVSGKRDSQLRQWPVQLHLVSPMAPYYQGADVLLSADCVAYSLGDFHKDLLTGKGLAIACPKLDDGQDIYVSKITSLIDDAKINTLTVAIMEVPCCHGLLAMAQAGVAAASRKIPLKAITVGIRGDVLSEEWV